MKGQWRAVYRFKFPWNPRAGQWRSRVFNTEEAANKFLQDVCALHDAEGKVQPATFRLPRNIAITIDGKIVKRNPVMRRNPKKLEFISYLWNTLIPDVKEAGHEFTAEDLETLATFLEGEGGHRGPEVNGWTVDKFERYLRDTLIPDLRKSGRTETAQDFATGLRYLGATAYRMTRVRKPMKQNPLKLKPLKSNMTELSIDVPGFRGETKILFSYQTPVAAYNLSPEWHDQFGGSFIRTSKKWSVTTSKHINQWLEGAKAHPVDQSVLDNLSEGKMKTNPHKRSSKKPLSAKQKAARERFVNMVRSGAFKKRGRNAKKRDPFGGTIRRKRRIRRTRKNPIRSKLLCLKHRSGKWWYLNKSGTALTDSRTDAKRFASDAGALAWAQKMRAKLIGNGFVSVETR